MSSHLFYCLSISLAVTWAQISKKDSSLQTIVPKTGNCCSHTCPSHLMTKVTISSNNTRDIVEIVCNALLQRPNFLQVNGNCYATIFASSILRFFGARFATDVDNSICLNIPSQTRPADTKDNFVVRPTHTIVDAVIDLITYWKWNNSTWILDPHSDFSEKEIYYRSEIRKIHVHCKTITSDEVTNAFISDLTSKENNGYVLAIQNDTLNALMMQLLSLRVLNQTSWIFIYPDWPFHTFPTYKQAIERTQFTLIATQSTSGMGKICVNLSQFDNWENVREICSENSIPQILPRNISRNNRIESNITLKFYDIFYSSKTQHIEQVEFAMWNVHDGLRFVQSLYDKDQLKYRHVFGVGCPYPPMIILKDDGSVSGYLGAFFQEIADSLRLNCHITVYKNCFSGVFMKGGWTGLIGHVANKEFDFIVLNYGMTSQRGLVARFTPSVSTAIARFMMSSNKDICTDRINYALYLKPFHSLVWSTLIILLAVTTVIWILGYRTLNNNLHKNWIYWLISGNILLDAFDSEVREISSRIFVFTFMLTGYLSFCCYSSVLTSSLAIEEEVWPFRNLDELAENQDYSVLVLRGTTFVDYFRYSTPGSPHAKIWQRINSSVNNDLDNLVPNLNIASEILHTRQKYVAVVEGNNRILTLWEGRSYKFIPCDIGFREINYMPMRPDFPFSHIVSNIITRMKETGLKDRFNKMYATEWKTLENEREVVLELKDVASLCILLLTGIVLSFISLCIELLYIRFKTGRSTESVLYVYK